MGSGMMYIVCGCLMYSSFNPTLRRRKCNLTFLISLAITLSGSSAEDFRLAGGPTTIDGSSTYIEKTNYVHISNIAKIHFIDTHV